MPYLDIQLTETHRVSISPECISKFNELKLNKTIKFILYKLSDDYKEIVVEETSDDGDWDVFREKLVNAQSKTKTVCLQTYRDSIWKDSEVDLNVEQGKIGKGPRYAVYDFNYDLASGEGSRSKITFIAWSPDDAGIQVITTFRILTLHH